MAAKTIDVGTPAKKAFNPGGFGDMKRTRQIRPALPVGALLDVMTGHIEYGRFGESYLVGGLNNYQGVAALPNCGKSVLSQYMQRTVMARFFPVASWMIHDVESTALRKRIVDQLRRDENLNTIDFDDPECSYFLYSDLSTGEDGSEHFDAVRKLAKERMKNNDLVVRTPFWDAKLKRYEVMMAPLCYLLDSLSAFTSGAAEEQYEKTEVGASDANTVYFTNSKGKSQMIEQFMGVVLPAGIYAIHTAHIGEQYSMDKYNPAPKVLAELKSNLKIKRVPPVFSSYTNGIWGIMKYEHANINRSGARLVEYPDSEVDSHDESRDLMRLTVMNLRGKNGPTGEPFEMLMSQRDGIIPELTEFNYIHKTMEGFGISGNDRSYFLDAWPEEKLSRTTVRRKITSIPKLARALNFTSELCQFRQIWGLGDPLLRTTPKEVMEKIIAKGYDWDLLMDTRSWWTIIDYNPENLKPFLSNYDLLRMAEDKYHPYWYPKTRAEMGLPEIDYAAQGLVIDM